MFPRATYALGIDIESFSSKTHNNLIFEIENFLKFYFLKESLMMKIKIPLAFEKVIINNIR
jgi:hypothetical protein